MKENNPEEKTLGITVKKDADLSEWYSQVIMKSELADYSAVSGCMVLRPLSYGMWEKIQSAFDKMIKKTGHKNVYFPLLIPESLFKREKEHVEGFTPEVAWVTYGGDTKLNERLAIRPTSETIMYDSYSKWVRSWRDLPLLLNQWCNIVRWEFQHPKPFLRTREFLWQEGHTVHADEKDCDREVLTILNFYQEIMEKYLAIPVLKGKKSESEKFPGALYTTTLEARMPDGKALQMSTSHNLGTNFAKAFNISYLGQDGKNHEVWQTSWGMSTRTIGAVVLAHGDDKGLILPPRIAPIQIVIVPILFDEHKEKILKKCSEIKEILGKKFSVEIDSRDGYKPGWKYFEWEMKGVPLRLEIGPRDMEKNQVMAVRRDTGEKIPIAEENLKSGIKKILVSIQKHLYRKAEKSLKENIIKAKTWDSFVKGIEDKKFVKALHCGNAECEAKIKEELQATNRVIPFKQPNLENKKCVKCGSKAKYLAYFARNY